MHLPRSRFLPYRILGLLLPALLSVAGAPLRATAAPATPTPPQKAIVLRQPDGRPVAGVTVHLVGANGAPRTAVTDSSGGVLFSDLIGFWTVTFSGTVQGQPIQPLAAQGQPPYGTNAAGGGFRVQVEPQSEDAAPTPVLIAGLVQPEVQMSRFVLLPIAGGWAVTWDLAGSEGQPLPYTALTTGFTGLSTPIPAGRATDTRPAVPTPAPTSPVSGGWLTVGFLGLGLGVLGYLGYLRRQERQARATPPRRDAA